MLALLWSAMNLDFRGDGLSQFTLHQQHISGVAVVGLRPQMGVGRSMNQLCGHVDAVTGALHGTFNHGVDVEVPRNLRQGLVGALVMHDGSPGDYVKRADLG